MPKVSIIMGIYNCEETLADAIDSIVNQSYKDWELIMCDDGSSDRSIEIAMSYVSLHPQKMYLIQNEKNKGLAFTLNRCLKMSKGKYIARMDSDDISIKERLEIQVDFLERNHKYDVVGSNMIVFNAEGEQGIRYIKEECNYESLKFGVPHAHPTIMMRKSAYDSIGGYSIRKNITRCEDLDLWIKFYSKRKLGYNIQYPLLKYRESLDSYKKRKVRYGFETMIIYIQGFYKLKYPLRYYPITLKPLISALLPNKLNYLYHKSKLIKPSNSTR